MKHPERFFDLPSVVNFGEFEKLTINERVNYIQDLLYAHLGRDNNKIVLNPYFATFGMKVLGYYCLAPDKVSGVDPLRVISSQQFTESFARLDGVVQVDSYDELEVKLLSHHSR